MDKGVEILGYKVAPFTMEDVLTSIYRLIGEKRGQIVTANAEILYAAKFDRRLSEVVHRAELVIADGMGVVWASRILGDPVPERVGGYDVLHALCKAAPDKGIRVFLLGGDHRVADMAAVRLQQLYPGLDVAGTCHGFFKEDESESVIEHITMQRPDFIFVALGLRGEYWIAEHKDELPCPAMQVGGSFDILAGRAERAPLWMQKRGLEWAFRLYKEPRRFKRMLALPKFMWTVILERLTGR